MEWWAVLCSEGPAAGRRSAAAVQRQRTGPDGARYMGTQIAHEGNERSDAGWTWHRQNQTAKFGIQVTGNPVKGGGLQQTKVIWALLAPSPQYAYTHTPVRRRLPAARRLQILGRLLVAHLY